MENNEDNIRLLRALVRLQAKEPDAYEQLILLLKRAGVNASDRVIHSGETVDIYRAQGMAQLIFELQKYIEKPNELLIEIEAQDQE
ncbi:hypothetical protein J7384_17100 [Endozoicomonas sp. G2_1]|uniref:hypothetical protein n=1 Tax=Endozoicomonas sp. G2_1 TaxID=2821091 RepID=UPI001ADBAC03|nr:hypothetical protein [Endozoicomonas sp. G2_1]MBO9492082.1 hypothetical protein [Endozoicomonas sp. G2_1]